jgi:hypothetical protein
MLGAPTEAMVRSVLWCGLLAASLGACRIGAPELEVKPGEHVTLENGVNGDVGCDRGSIYLPASESINGDLDSSYCVLKVAGTVNGSITAHGGIIHVLDVLSINGELAVRGAHEVFVTGSDFNGGLDVEDSRSVVVLSTGFNGDGEVFGNGDVEIWDNSFNGSLTIRDSGSCTASNNDTNGTLFATDCSP